MTRMLTEYAYEAHQARFGRGARAPDRREAPQQATLLELRTLVFELPMPLSVNDAWHHIPYLDESTPSEWPLNKRLRVRTVLTDDHRQYRSMVIAIVRGAMFRAEQRGQPLLGRVEITARWFFADRRRTDINNRWKALEDALTHAGAWRDDSQIDLSHGERVIRPNVPEGCEVTITEITT